MRGYRARINLQKFWDTTLKHDRIKDRESKAHSINSAT